MKTCLGAQPAAGTQTAFAAPPGTQTAFSAAPPGTQTAFSAPGTQTAFSAPPGTQTAFCMFSANHQLLSHFSLLYPFSAGGQSPTATCFGQPPAAGTQTAFTFSTPGTQTAFSPAPASQSPAGEFALTIFPLNS